MKKASLVQIVILEGFLSAAMRDRSDKCRRGLEKVKEGVAPGREYLFSIIFVIHIVPIFVLLANNSIKIFNSGYHS